MAYKINTTEYMYCSSRIRALENQIMGKDFISSLVETSSYEEVLNRISEKTGLISDPDGVIDVEGMLEKIFSDACTLIEKLTPDAKMYEFLRYGYDCNNIKTAIKCRVRGIDPSGMLFECGTKTAEDAVAAVAGEDVGYPANMAKAAIQAQEIYAKTKNPQGIDICVDKACFADMLENAGKYGSELSVKLVNTRITLINIMICIRLISMNLLNSTGEKLIREALLEGGSFERDFYPEACAGGLDRLFEMLEYTDYGKFAAFASENRDNLGLIEKYADDRYMEVAKEAKMIPFGPEVAIGYLVAREYEVKNLRILTSAKRNRISPTVIRERLRESYV